MSKYIIVKIDTKANKARIYWKDPWSPSFAKVEDMRGEAWALTKPVRQRA